MKVILKDEVINLGLAGDVVDVADGYGRNYLIPRGMALLATRGAMKEAEALTRSRKTAEAKTVGQAEEYQQVLEARTLRIPARVDERGHLYGSVSTNDVHRVLKERGHEVDRRRIDLKGTLKQIGTYEIPVQVHPQVTATVVVEVVDEEGQVTVTPGGGIEAVSDEPAEVAPTAAGVGTSAEADVDAENVEAAATEAAASTETDADVLAEQALEAAQAYEAEQALRERESGGDEPTDDETADEAADTG